VGEGINPDITVYPDIVDLIRGKDTVLDYAISYLENKWKNIQSYLRRLSGIWIIHPLLLLKPEHERSQVLLLAAQTKKPAFSQKGFVPVVIKHQHGNKNRQWILGCKLPGGQA